jgi:hypothetical protein
MARYDASNGIQEWLQPLEEELEFDAGQKYLAFMPDGNLLVGANSMAASFDGQPNLGAPNTEGEYPYDILVMGYDAEDGARLWTRRHGGSADDFMDGLIVGTNGYYHISGNTNGDLDSHMNAGGMDIFTWKANMTP